MDTIDSFTRGMFPHSSELDVYFSGVFDSMLDRVKEAYDKTSIKSDLERYNVWKDEYNEDNKNSNIFLTNIFLKIKEMLSNDIMNEIIELPNELEIALKEQSLFNPTPSRSRAYNDIVARNEFPSYKITQERYRGNTITYLVPGSVQRNEGISSGFMSTVSMDEIDMDAHNRSMASNYYLAVPDAYILSRSRSRKYPNWTVDIEKPRFDSFPLHFTREAIVDPWINSNKHYVGNPLVASIIDSDVKMIDAGKRGVNEVIAPVLRSESETSKFAAAFPFTSGFIRGLVDTAKKIDDRNALETKLNKEISRLIKEEKSATRSGNVYRIDDALQNTINFLRQSPGSTVFNRLIGHENDDISSLAVTRSINGAGKESMDHDVTRMRSLEYFASALSRVASEKNKRENKLGHGDSIADLDDPVEKSLVKSMIGGINIHEIMEESMKGDVLSRRRYDCTQYSFSDNEPCQRVARLVRENIQIPNYR